MTEELRKIERMKPNGEWEEVTFEQLRDRDCFRMFEKDVLYVDEDGKDTFIAVGEPYKNLDGIWEIQRIR